MPLKSSAMKKEVPWQCREKKGEQKMEGKIMLHELESVMEKAVENIFRNQKLRKYWNGDIY